MTEAVRKATEYHIHLAGRRVEYRLVRSTSARRVRVRIGPGGVEVVHPARRGNDDVPTFLIRNKAWVLAQLDRVARLPGVQKAEKLGARQILFRGELTEVRVEASPPGRRNVTEYVDQKIVVRRAGGSRTPVAHSLERWLRRQARIEIEKHVAVVAARVRQHPQRIYVMAQRTKWGNCSARRNLSFNWRLILAPDFVLRYFVTHEVVHLAVPDHSARFWLTVQSLCPDMGRAQQWLCRHQIRLQVDLSSVLAGSRSGRGGPHSTEPSVSRGTSRLQKSDA